MTRANEDAMDKRLRWMNENLLGAYMARHPDGHPKAGGHCTNSGTCILACCYINALGKVLLKGAPPQGTQRRDFARFNEFIRRCMNDFVVESAASALPITPRWGNGGADVLYYFFRNGFVHGYPGVGVGWGRWRDSNNYWFRDRHGRLILNIDELVRGFQRGIGEFRRLAAADPDLRSGFKGYITK
jgi:hypothetical protein